VNIHGAWLPVVVIICGLLAVGAGLREARRQWRMRRFGVHSTGVVLRYEMTQRARGAEGKRAGVIIGSTDYSDSDLGESPAFYAPVIEFTDEDGTRQEFRGKVSSANRKLPKGSQVPVTYLPGRPETAMLDTLGYKAALLVFPLGVGAVFVAAGLWFALR
jgi:hypothetical protein